MIFTSEKIAKFTPFPSQVAPRGHGDPGSTRNTGTKFFLIKGGVHIMSDDVFYKGFFSAKSRIGVLDKSDSNSYKVLVDYH